MCDFDNDDDDEGQVTDQIVIETRGLSKHLSECAISMGFEELGCTCFDDSPEWTL